MITLATFLFIGPLGVPETLIIVFVVLLLFGGKKLPELARGLGRGIREFKDASREVKDNIEKAVNDDSKD
jgi:sec-independent protein translocase protein TatA